MENKIRYSTNYEFAKFTVGVAQMYIWGKLDLSKWDQMNFIAKEEQKYSLQKGDSMSGVPQCV